MPGFRAPKETIGDLDGESAAALVRAAADLALVVDHAGVIRDLAHGLDEPDGLDLAGWLGRPWLDTVGAESRPKIEALLRDAAVAAAPTRPRWRQVNHPLPGGLDLPVLYAVVRLHADGRVMAVGRDLRPLAALQRRLVDAQQAMERDYIRLRRAETRYRLLFHSAREAVLLADLATRRILEANPAAGVLLGTDPDALVGRGLLELFALDDAATLQALLAAVSASGRSQETRLRSAHDQRELSASISLCPGDPGALFLVHLLPIGDRGEAPDRHEARLLAVVRAMPDGFVVTNDRGRVLAVNAAFLRLVGLVSEAGVLDEPLERWLGRPGIDLPVLLANLRRQGVVRLFATSLRSEHGPASEVEITAVAVPTGEQPCYGFAIREVGRRLDRLLRDELGLPRSTDQLAELVGRVPLKTIVREATELVERLCIETALAMTGDNRASAAELLGLSRQSLYVKLRHYGPRASGAASRFGTGDRPS